MSFVGPATASPLLGSCHLATAHSPQSDDAPESPRRFAAQSGPFRRKSGISTFAIVFRALIDEAALIDEPARTQVSESSRDAASLF
jgi:hypothetical protein